MSTRLRSFDDQGSVSLVAVAACGVLMVLLVLGGVVGDLLAARHRAATAADLGALSAVPGIARTDAEACGAASFVVRENGGELRACEVINGEVWVTASAHPRGPWTRWLGALLGSVPAPTVRAHAGLR